MADYPSNSLDSISDQARVSSEAFRKKLADANSMLIQKSKELHEKLKQMTLEAACDEGLVKMSMTPDGTNIETTIDQAINNIQKSGELHEKLKHMPLEATSDEGLVKMTMTADGTNIETTIDKTELKNTNLFGLQKAISLTMTRLLEKNRKLSEEQAKLLSKSLMEDFSRSRELESETTETTDR